VGDRSEFVLQDKGLSNEKSDVTFVGGVCLRRDHVRSLFERVNGPGFAGGSNS
jgi:hypothetical protein